MLLPRLLASLVLVGGPGPVVDSDRADAWLRVARMEHAAFARLTLELAAAVSDPEECAGRTPGRVM